MALSWRQFEDAAPLLAEVGKRFLYRPDRGQVALLATVDRGGQPRIAPVSPIFCDAGLYLSIGAHTPKVHHLLMDHKGYALHALVGEDDEEFQISGRARFVGDEGEHAAVVAAIPFPAYDATDPIFELLIERALTATWPEKGKFVKRTWPARPPPGP